MAFSLNSNVLMLEGCKTGLFQSLQIALDDLVSFHSLSLCFLCIFIVSNVDAVKNAVT